MRPFLILLAVVALLGAAAPGEKSAKPPASKPAPIVLVTKLDGTLTPGSDGKTATVLLASDDATRQSLQAALGQ